MPDTTKGAINGRIALIAVPISAGRDDKLTPLPIDHCQAHLVETQDETHERVYPCGTWFQPPVGRYLFWMENQVAVSFQSVIHYAGEQFRHSGALFPKPLYPAGSIELESATNVPPGATFRFLSLHIVKNYRPFDRRIAAVRAKSRIHAPAGAAVAGVFDGSGRAASLSKPFIVKPGRVAVVNPETPQEGRAALVVVLNRFEHPPLRRCAVTLMESSGRRIAPAVDLQAYDRVVMIWYDLLASGNTRIAVSCNSQQPFVQTVHLVSGQIETVRRNLHRKVQ